MKTVVVDGKHENKSRTQLVETISSLESLLGGIWVWGRNVGCGGEMEMGFRKHEGCQMWSFWFQHVDLMLEGCLLALFYITKRLMGNVKYK